MGAAGAIGSNLVQDLLSTGTANNIVMYDPFAAGLEGAAEEIYHCAYPGARVTWTTDVEEALTDVKYVISSGGAPRKEGMTREDLLFGNCEIAKGLGEGLAKYGSGAEFVVTIFNPADITGLTVLVYSGLKPGFVTTLAALDSTRLQTKLSQHFGVPQDDVTGCTTYGGHGEKMAVFKGSIAVQGTKLTDILAGATVNGKGMTAEEWAEVQSHTRNGGGRIIKLRGRSSFQSPSPPSVEMLRGRIRNGGYPWPCGAYFKDGPYANVMMAADTKFTEGDGIVGTIPQSDAEDMASLDESYKHLCIMRDEVIAGGLLPPVDQWKSLNPHL